ncbi:MAG: 50S ribosomal protein L23 [Clostridiales bacterium]|nr:50S ribosomal protein L23 [Clostridiales bacterium]
MNAYDIIKKPLISEKSYAGIPDKKYVFIVDVNADKKQVKAAVEKAFDGVKVEKVNVVNVDGKYKRQGRTEGFTAKYKKAYVKLTADSKPIAFFESLN